MDSKTIQKHARDAYEWSRPRSLADAIQIGGAVVAALIFASGYMGDLGEFRPIAPLLAVAFFAFALWALSLFKRIWGSEPQHRPDAPAAPQALTAAQPAVEFWLPSNWGPGFRFRNLDTLEAGNETHAEEVHVRVVAKQKMENVRFEISVRQRHGTRLETLAQVGSSVFAGAVPKGAQQTIAIMRRTFWMVQTYYDHPASDEKKGAQIRAEKDVVFLPGDAAEFPGKLNQRYHFQITVLHDEGPDEAHFSIELEREQRFAQSRIVGMENIRPIMGQ